MSDAVDFSLDELVGSLTVPLSGILRAWHLIKSGSYDEAKNILLKLSAEGDSLSQFMLGELFYNVKDYAQAHEWLNKASSNGQEEANLLLGQIYEYGHGVKLDEGIAIALYESLALKGNSTAQFLLGALYEFAQSNHQSFKRAAKWYTLAAEQGCSESQFNLALLYERGDGVDRNIETAASWYEKAACGGLFEAQYALGCLYQNEDGSYSDKLACNSKAYKWALIANENQPEIEDVLNLIKELEALMTDREKDLAISEYEIWQEKSKGKA